MQTISNSIDVCALCGVSSKLTLHHLIPQVKCHNKYKQVKNEASNHVMICRPCHEQIHALYDENWFRDNLNTVEKPKSDEKLVKFVEWRRKHPEFNGHAKRSKEW